MNAPKVGSFIILSSTKMLVVETASQDSDRPWQVVVSGTLVDFKGELLNHVFSVQKINNNTLLLRTIEPEKTYFSYITHHEFTSPDEELIQMVLSPDVETRTLAFGMIYTKYSKK